jgi:hypothetical protein
MLNRDSSMVDGDRLVVVGVGKVGGCSTASLSPMRNGTSSFADWLGLAQRQGILGA